MDEDEKLVHAAEKARRHEAKEHRAMLRWMLSQKPARRFLSWLLFGAEATNIRGSVFDREPMAMATKVGIQQVGLAVQGQLMDADHEQYLKMLAEYRDLQETISEVDNDN